MKIDNRKKKIESDKIIKEVLMYICLVKQQRVYDYEINVVSPTLQRSLQRYCKELVRSGAIPKIRLKHDKNGQFYEISENILDTNKRFYRYPDDKHSNRLARVLSLIYLIEINHPIASKLPDLRDFYFKRLNIGAGAKSFSRDLKLINIAYSFYNSK